MYSGRCCRKVVGGKHATTARLFDGNIRKQYWKSNIDEKERSFEYNYDGASRIKSGIFGSTNAGENYSLNNVNYDFNGNITNLSRNGWKSNNTFGLVDNLNYTYNSNSNKILKVEDGANDVASFSDVAGNDYTYSLDGSLISDANKGIAIEYNYLKKPKKITFSNNQTIEYQYDATGTKLREKAKDGTWTDYFGNLIHKANTLYQIGIDEGRINAQNEYEYGIQDHLGNVRVMFRDSLGVAKITQTENFGIWGEELKGLTYQSNASKRNNFTYQGKEFIEQTGEYDFGARMYDPIIGRWGVIDPHAENYYNLSGYNFVANNPILYTDPDGRDIGFSKAGETTDKKTGITTITYNINVSMAVMNSSSMSSKDYQSAVSSFTNQLTKSLTGSFSAGDKTQIAFQAGDIDVRSVSSMSDVKSTDHLMVVVDNVTGMDAKGGQAGGLADIGGKVAYVEAGNVAGVAGNMVHEFGHNMGLSHNFETSNKGDDGATNHMGYGNVRNQFAGVQLLQSLNKSNAQPSQLNIGNNYEILRQDYNTNGRTTQQMPLQYNVGRGGRIPRTLKN